MKVHAKKYLSGVDFLLCLCWLSILGAGQSSRGKELYLFSAVSIQSNFKVVHRQVAMTVSNDLPKESGRRLASPLPRVMCMLTEADHD